MKLSKQERIGLLIILSVVILALGAFLIVKPAFEEVKVTQSKLESKEKELKTLQDKQATKGPLRQSILEAYEEGAHLADMFFPEMKSYELDDAFREFIHQVKSNVVVQQVSVSQPATATLSATFFNTSNVSYALKSYATQGVEATEEEVALANRMAAIRSALSGTQTLGASRVDFTVYALSYDDLLKFTDEINEYMKDENGTEVRKATSIDALSIQYPVVDWLYSSMIAESTDYMTSVGIADFNSLTGSNLNVPNVSAPTTPVVSGGSEGEGGEGGEGGAVPSEPAPSVNIGGDELKWEPGLQDYLISRSMTMTFYCIERMQDPTAQLNAQDGITE